MRYLDENSVDDIAVGAGILGTGGGGDPHVGMLLAKTAIRAHGSQPIVDLDEVRDDDLIVPVAMMGAPTVANEKLATLDGLVGAAESVSRHLDRPIAFTIPAEVGGINSLLPVALAAELGIGLVDGDLMGRAFPEIQMALPTLFGVHASPLAMADEKGNTVLINTIDNSWTERLARSVAIDMGATSIMALYAMTGAQARRAIVRASLGLSEDLGRVVREARATHDDPVDSVAARLSGHRLFDGKLVDVRRETSGGFSRMETLVEGLGGDSGSMMRILSQNEHLVAERDGGVLATTPDLIILLDTDTGDPLTTESLRFGFRVSVVVASADPRYRSDSGLELVGPRAFGYDLDYVPAQHQLLESS